MKAHLYLLFLTCCLPAILRAQSPKYFPGEPNGKIRNRKMLENFSGSYYSSFLTALNEPVLYTDTINREVYRFTYLRTFHQPLAVRIEKHNETYTVFWKVTNGMGGYQPGNIIIEKHRQLNEKEWLKIQFLLKKMNYWKMPLLIINDDPPGSDGSQWILEGKTSQKYHVVDRWVGGSVDYKQCCKYLLSLTDIELKKDEFY